MSLEVQSGLAENSNVWIEDGPALRDDLQAILHIPFPQAAVDKNTLGNVSCEKMRLA